MFEKAQYIYRLKFSGVVRLHYNTKESDRSNVKYNNLKTKIETQNKTKSKNKTRRYNQGNENCFNC